NNNGSIIYDSYITHLNGNSHLGHFRAVAINYTFDERNNIKRAVKKAIIADIEYTFYNLYTYNWDINSSNTPMWYEDNIPYSLNIMPIGFRCDGLVEWATEIALNPINPSQSDGFYSENNDPIFDWIRPIDITKKPIDKIGIPDKPILSLEDENVLIEFPEVSGAWKEALYSLYRSDSNNVNNGSDYIYCGKNKSYTDIITDDMGGKYYYFLKIGERTASCDNIDIDFSDFSESSSIELQEDCKSPKLFEIVSQSFKNTIDWRVSVKDKETNATQENVYPFNLSGSLYQLESGEWVIASCRGTTISETWEDKKDNEIYKLDNSEEEIIVSDRFISSETNDTIIDTKYSLIWDNQDKEISKTWIDANNYCKTLTLDSYEKWSLPTLFDLQSIVNPTSDNNLYEEFTKLASNPYGYWSDNNFFGYNQFMPWILQEQASVFMYENNRVSEHSTSYEMNVMCVQWMY
nr:DUF1566 domain-containing protein [Sulfurovaceae bacterium]